TGASNERMRLRNPCREIGEKGPHLRIHPKPGVSAAHSFRVFVARLLDKNELAANTFRNEGKGRGHDIRKNPRALRAARYEDFQPSIRPIRERHFRRVQNHWPDWISSKMDPRRQLFGQSAKDLEPFGDRVDPRSEEPVSAANDRVAFMQERRNAKPRPREQRRNRRQAPTT